MYPWRETPNGWRHELADHMFVEIQTVPGKLKYRVFLVVGGAITKNRYTDDLEDAMLLAYIVAADYAGDILQACKRI